MWTSLRQPFLSPVNTHPTPPHPDPTSSPSAMPEQDTATKPATFLGIKMKARPAGTNTGKEVPEKNANIVSRTLFSWMTPLLVVRLSPVFSLRAFADIVRFPPTKQTGVTRPVSLVLLACVGLDCGGDRCPRGTSIWMCYVDRDPLASTSSCSARARRYLVSVCSLTPPGPHDLSHPLWDCLTSLS